ncbi:MAG TPA: hypothetical protein VF611_15795, partial [Pyrinomonadaceae bacterium]
ISTPNLAAAAARTRSRNDCCSSIRFKVAGSFNCLGGRPDRHTLVENDFAVKAESITQPIRAALIW